MKSKLLFLLVLLFGTISVHGQTKQDFESGTFPPEGWTLYHLLGISGNQNGWIRQLQPKTNVASDKNNAAFSQSGRLSADTDSWLITPKTRIKNGDHLNFMLKITGASETTMDTLDIVLSVTGKERSDFTTRLLRITPKNELQWSHYCIDLSAYAGKEIYVAFHDHLLKPSSPLFGCKTFLDDVEITGNTFSDLSVCAILSPVIDCSTTQFVSLNVINAGKQVDEYTLCYQSNGGKIEKETITGIFEANSQKTFTFKTPVEFAENSKNAFKAWVECKEDNNPANDSLVTNVTIGSQIPFPYMMAERTSVATDFSSFGALGKWTYTNVNILPEKALLYIGTSGKGTLGSGCIDLPKGKVRLSFDYATTRHAVLKVKNASIAGLVNYRDTIGQSPVLYGDGKIASASFVIDIPRGGLQSLGLVACVPDEEATASPSSLNESFQFILNKLRIEPAYEDLSVDELVNPVETSVSTSETEKEVMVRITNLGSKDRSDFWLSYQSGEEEKVSEAYNRILKPGESDVYTFSRKIKFGSTGRQDFSVWIDSEQETNTSNDSIVKSIFVYDPFVMPYRMSFEESEEFDNWTFVNANRDAVEWKVEDSLFKGNKAARLPYVKGITNDDYLISPAIYLPAGKARISFFYILNHSGNMKMNLLMGKSAKPEDLKTTLLTLTENITGWSSGYALIDVTKAGYYHFAVHGKGPEGTIMLDDIRIDTEIDACMQTVEFGEKGNYNLTESPLRIAFSNNSSKSINEAKVSYQLNGKEIISETIKKEILPGERIEHTFRQPADISAIGTHSVRAWVEVRDDAEELNNTMTATHKHYKNKQLPYFQNFEDTETRYRWTTMVKDQNQDSNCWIPAGNASGSAYSGTTCLYYDSSFAGDDWIFSECIEIPAGDLEFSFFYRTFKNFADRKENFKIMLGTSPDPESMTIEVANFKETSFSDPQEQMKVIRRFTMAENGKYYIGFYTDSPVTRGFIAIDDISLRKYEEKTPFYLSDFTDRYDEWTPYKLYATSFDQWTKVTEEGKEYDIVQLKTFKASTQPGIFASPGFKIEKDQAIDLEMEYALLSSNENNRFGLYMGNENHPDSITTLVEELPVTTDWEIYRKTVSVEQSGRYFFAIKALKVDKDKNSFYKLGYFKLTPSGLESYGLEGKLTDAAGHVIAGAVVDLIAGQSQQTVTGEDGKFTFAQVLNQQTFTLRISKDKFVTHTQTIKLEGAAKDLGAVILKYELLKPSAVEALLNAEQKVTVNWVVPGNLTEYRYDDGIAFGQVGFNSGTANDVMGSVFRSPAQVSQISWFTTSASGVHEKVNVFLLALDQDGEPTNTVLYECADVPSRDMEWSSHHLPEPVNAPNGFMVAVSYNSGSLSLAIDDGLEDYSFNSKTCYIGSLLSGEFSTFESQGGKSSFLVRAKGTPLSASSAIPAMSELARAAIAYQVYRLEKNDQANEANWILLTQEPTVQTTFTDDASALNGEYIYAVKAVYPSNEKSEAVLSNVITIIKDGITTGSASEGLQIWPVLATDYVSVKSESRVKAYIIYDLTGVAVERQQVDEQNFIIPVGKLLRGHYVVSLFTDDGKVDRRIIRQ